MGDIRFLGAIAAFALGAILFVDALGSLAEYVTSENMNYLLFANGPLLKGYAILVVVGVELMIAFSFLYIAYKINAKYKKSK